MNNVHAIIDDVDLDVAILPTGDVVDVCGERVYVGADSAVASRVQK